MSGADYFTYTDLVAGGLARAADINARMGAVQTAFGLLPHYDLLHQNRLGYRLGGGTANAVTASSTSAIASYVAGLELTVKLTTTNTGAATINVDGVGAKTIKRADGSALQAGDLTSGQLVKLVYDGTDFRLIGASETAVAASATAAAASAAAAAASATAAATSATNAATSATNAANSATAAAASATAAANSATDAANEVASISGSLALKAPIDAPTFTTSVTLPGAPTSALQAATKQYVDDSVAANRDKEACRLATTANHGLSGTANIDGVAPVAGDRILVKSQTAKAENGIYIAAAGAWSRATDMDAWAEVPQAFVFVTAGTANANTGWVFSAASSGTIGVTDIDIFQRSAAGSYTADGTSITLTGSSFGLTSIANNRVLGNVSGGAAVPTALTGTQLTALLDTFTTAAKGAVPTAPVGSNAYLCADGTWDTALTPASIAATGNITGLNLSGTNTGDQTTISGNAGTATALETARTIAISGAVTGTATSFDGTANITIPITAMNMDSATSGTLAVARGGTGVATATGTGSVVLSASPALTGTPTGPTAAAATNTTQLATTAFVQQELAGYATTSALNNKADAMLATSSFSTNKTLSDNDNNELLTFTGGTIRTLTLNSTPSTGMSCIIHSTASVGLTVSAASGVYKNGATATATSGTVPAGGVCTFIHKGAGVWIAKGDVS